jgi:arylsulfatase A-like enzyme
VWTFDTPFKWCKQVASHFGGTAQGVAMSWPGHIKDLGGIRRQFHHIIDVVPTILEATGIPAPDTINGIKQLPIEGTSMVYTWDKADANALTRHTTQYFEMLGNRAIVPVMVGPQLKPNPGYYSIVSEKQISQNGTGLVRNS